MVYTGCIVLCFESMETKESDSQEESVAALWTKNRTMWLERKSALKYVRKVWYAEAIPVCVGYTDVLYPGLRRGVISLSEVVKATQPRNSNCFKITVAFRCKEFPLYQSREFPA